MCVYRKVHLHFNVTLVFLSPEVCHGFPHEAQVQVKPHTGDMSRLLPAKQVPRTANFKVFHGQLQTRA